MANSWSSLVNSVKFFYRLIFIFISNCFLWYRLMGVQGYNTSDWSLALFNRI